MNQRIYTPLHDHLASDTSVRRGNVCRGENHSEFLAPRGGRTLFSVRAQ